MEEPDPRIEVAGSGQHCDFSAAGERPLVLGHTSVPARSWEEIGDPTGSAAKGSFHCQRARGRPSALRPRIKWSPRPCSLLTGIRTCHPCLPRARVLQGAVMASSVLPSPLSAPGAVKGDSESPSSELPGGWLPALLAGRRGCRSELTDPGSPWRWDTL